MEFLIVLLMSFSVFAADEVTICREMVKNVLKTGATYDEKVGDYVFIKDEAKALALIKQYDATKLGIQDSLAKTSLMLSDCKYYDDKKFNQSFCESAFPNYEFLKGLLYGLKNYGWKQSTIDLGKQKVTEFIKATTVPGIQPVNLAIAESILELYLSVFPDKNIDLKELKQARIDLEKTIQETSNYNKKNITKTCADGQANIKKEQQSAEKHRQVFAKLIQKL